MCLLRRLLAHLLIAVQRPLCKSPRPPLARWPHLQELHYLEAPHFLPATLLLSRHQPLLLPVTLPLLRHQPGLSLARAQVHLQVQLDSPLAPVRPPLLLVLRPRPPALRFQPRYTERKPPRPRAGG